MSLGVHASGARHLRDGNDPTSILQTILSRLQHLDLTGRIHFVSSAINCHGGYADIFTGFAKLEWREAKVAIKRLRLHIMSDYRFAKVKFCASFRAVDLLSMA